MFVSERANLQDRVKLERREIGVRLFWGATILFIDQDHLRFDTRALDDRPAADFAGNLLDHIAACPVHDCPYF